MDQQWEKIKPGGEGEETSRVEMSGPKSVSRKPSPVEKKTKEVGKAGQACQANTERIFRSDKKKKKRGEKRERGADDLHRGGLGNWRHAPDHHEVSSLVGEKRKEREKKNLRTKGRVSEKESKYGVSASLVAITFRRQKKREKKKEAVYPSYVTLRLASNKRQPRELQQAQGELQEKRTGRGDIKGARHPHNGPEGLQKQRQKTLRIRTKTELTGGALSKRRRSSGCAAGEGR